MSLDSVDSPNGLDGVDGGLDDVAYAPERRHNDMGTRMISIGRRAGCARKSFRVALAEVA